MSKTLKISRNKFLAVFLVFAVAMLTIGGVLPTVVKANVAKPINNVDIVLTTMPEVGKTVASVTDNPSISFSYEGDHEIDYEHVAIHVQALDDTDPSLYDDMSPADVFEKDGFYRLAVELTDEDATYVAADPAATINGLNAYWENYVESDPSTPKAFMLEFQFSTVNYDSKGGSAVPSESVIMGNLFTEPEDPTKEGYEFRFWADEDGDWYYFDVAENHAEITLTAIWAPIINAASGDNQTFYLESGDNVVIKWDANYDDFFYAELYNTATGEYTPLDEDDYTLERGSTILTLKNSFLKTLDAGTYEVRAMFNDGNDNVSIAKATLTINEGSAPSTTPATGDSSNVIAYMSVGIIAVAGIAVVVTLKRRVNE